jgi:hypothetical protein
MTSERSLSSWERVFVHGGSALGLVVTRAIVFTVVLVDVSRIRVGTLDTLAESSWNPIDLLGLVSAPFPDDTTLTIVRAFTLIAAAIALVPRIGRFCAPVVFVGYTWLTLVLNSFGKIDHDRQPIVVMLACLAVAAAPTWDEASRWQFRWPVQACRIVLAVTLAAAAVSKIRNGGPEWVLSPHLRAMITMESELRDPAWETLGRWIAAEPWRWKPAAAGAIIGELALVLAVATRRLWVGRAAVMVGAATLAGIALVMDLAVFPLMILPVLFVECDRLVETWATGGRRLPSLVVPMAGCVVLVALRLQVGDQLRFVAPVVVAVVVVLAASGRGRATRVQSTRTRSGSTAANAAVTSST